MYYANRAASQQQRMAEFQRRQADLQAARQRRDEIRKNRLANAQQLVTSHAQGVEGSSGAMGGLDSLRSQGYSNISFLDTMNTLSDQASKAYGKSIRAGNMSNMFGGIANLAMSFASMTAGPTKPNEALTKPVNANPTQRGAPITYKGASPYATTPHVGYNNTGISRLSSFYTNNPNPRG